MIIDPLGSEDRIPTYAWVLPRPRVNERYHGGFPLFFEENLYRIIGVNPETDLVLHPFGGRAEFGIRCDLLREVKPDVICDAHHLPFRDGAFVAVVLDPPYSDKYSEDLFGIEQHLKPKDFIAESGRVLKNDGFLIWYHIFPVPVPVGFRWHSRIMIEHRTHHRLRWTGVWQKGWEMKPEIGIDKAFG